MIDFSNAKSIVTPKGEIAMISRGAEILFRKQKYKREVEYLESTGTQYIDTEFCQTNNTEIRFKAECTDGGSGTRCVFASGDTANTMSISAYLFNSGTNARWGKSIIINPYATSKTPHICVLNKSGFTVDGNTTAFDGNGLETNSIYPLILFAGASQGNIAQLGKVRMWYLQIYDNDVLVRDLRFLHLRNRLALQ